MAKVELSTFNSDHAPDLIDPSADHHWPHNARKHIDIVNFPNSFVEPKLMNDIATIEINNHNATARFSITCSKVIKERSAVKLLLSLLR